MMILASLLKVIISPIERIAFLKPKHAQINITVMLIKRKSQKSILATLQSKNFLKESKKIQMLTQKKMPRFFTKEHQLTLDIPSKTHLDSQRDSTRSLMEHQESPKKLLLKNMKLTSTNQTKKNQVKNFNYQGKIVFELTLFLATEPTKIIKVEERTEIKDFEVKTDEL